MLIFGTAGFVCFYRCQMFPVVFQEVCRHCRRDLGIFFSSLYLYYLSFYSLNVVLNTAELVIMIFFLNEVFDVTKEQLFVNQILPTKMSYTANLKNVMSMEGGQQSSENQIMGEQEMETSKPGPSPHDLAAQLKSSLLAEIGLTESDGPPLPSFR